MPAIPAGQLHKQQVVILPEGRKTIAKVEEVLPECMAQTFVTYTDGTTDQFCNFKNVMVDHVNEKYRSKPR